MEMRMARLALMVCMAWLPGSMAAPPNIVLIVSDDQRPDTIHALGNKTISTPHLDRLVQRGTVFTRAIAGYPICHVSRAEIITGCCAFRALAKYPAGGINPSLATLAGTLRAAGYHTWYSGKWHNDGQPKSRGYERTGGLFTSGGGRDLPTAKTDSQGHAVTGYTGWTFKTDDGAVVAEHGAGLTARTSEPIADGAISLIREATERPFFLHVNFASPHDPRLMPPGHEGRYDPAKMPLPGNLAPQHPFDHGNLDGRDEVLLKKPLADDDLRAEMACYYAVITHMDEQIGRIMAALAETGRLESTLVVFTTDQGLALGSHGLLGKQNMYEHTVGVPLIIAGPGARSGARSAVQCYLRDLFPTFCELAGVPIPSTVQGRSLRAALAGSAEAAHPFVVSVFTDTQRMIRDERWKLVLYPRAGRRQLFDLASDPLEITDLSGAAETREVARRLERELRSFLASEGDRALD